MLNISRKDFSGPKKRSLLEIYGGISYGVTKRNLILTVPTASQVTGMTSERKKSCFPNAIQDEGL